MQLYYLGPKGTFSYLACRQYFSENEATFQPKSNLFEVIKAVADDDTSIGVVPIENSIEEQSTLWQMHLHSKMSLHTVKYV
ncbi:hypothetical protein W211_02525 [Staphylococcus aureus DAR1084]|nr:hypothetical protein W211_02525 [Staphylococcus aureus DAR1084]